MARALRRAAWNDSDGVARLTVLCVACAAELMTRRAGKCVVRPFGSGSGECELCLYELHREVVE